MTLEISLSSSAPSGSGTFLYNTKVIDLSIKKKTVIREDLNVDGKPIIRFLGEKSPIISFNLLIEEYAASTADTTLGLTDLDVIRQAEIATTGGTYAWFRDTEGEYFLKHWKGGYITGLTIAPARGYPNVEYQSLYEVSFNLMVIDYSDAEKTLFKW